MELIHLCLYQYRIRHMNTWFTLIVNLYLFKLLKKHSKHEGPSGAGGSRKERFSVFHHSQKWLRSGHAFSPSRTTTITTTPKDKDGDEDNGKAGKNVGKFQATHSPPKDSGCVFIFRRRRRTASCFGPFPTALWSLSARETGHWYVAYFFSRGVEM